MASGIIPMAASTGDFEAQLVWSSTANANSNTSTLTITCQMKTIDTYTDDSKYSYGVGIYEADGIKAIEKYDTQQTEGKIFTTWLRWHDIFTKTFTIPHNQNGEKSVRLNVVAVNANNADWYATFEEKPLITLDTITRKATITSAPNFKDDENPTIKYSNPMGSSVSSLQVCIADSTGNTIYVPYRDISKTGTSYTFQLTSTERQTLINAVKTGSSIGVRFYIKMEIRGGAHRHSVDRTFSLTDIMPDLAPAVVDMNETTKALTGDMNVLVKYYSTAACSTNGTTKQGATIKTQKVVNGAVVREKTDGVFAIPNVESGKFEFSITDSRNNTTTATVNKTLIEYVRLTCNQNVEMSLAGETGATAAITISGNCFNNTFGAVKNTLALEVRYKESNGNYGNWAPIVDEFVNFDGNKYSINVSIENLQYDKTYVFQCRATDKLATATTGEYTIKLLPVFDWSESDFNFNVPVSIQGDTLSDYVVAYGSASMGSNGTWYWYHWKSGKAECYGVRNFGNMAVSTAWGGLYRSESFNQNIPSNVFIDTPAYIGIEYRGSNYGGWIAKHEGTAPSKSNTGGFIVVRPASATLSQAHIGFHVIGRWK